MGFMDKLKSAGQSLAKGAIAAAATSYGRVSSGKYSGCKIGMNSVYDTVTFIKVTKIEAQFVIKDSFRSFVVCKDNDVDGLYELELIPFEGESFRISLATDKNQGSALPTAERRIAAQYSVMADLVKALGKFVPELTDNEKMWVGKILRFANKA